MNHKVELDAAGWGGHPRLTCHTDGETLLRAPYMSTEQWLEQVRGFAAEHPCQFLADYCQRLVRDITPVGREGE